MFEEISLKKMAIVMAQNIETKALSKMISSNEIVTLINALGLDPKAHEIDLKRSKIWKKLLL